MKSRPARPSASAKCPEVVGQLGADGSDKGNYEIRVACRQGREAVQELVRLLDRVDYAEAGKDPSPWLEAGDPGRRAAPGSEDIGGEPYDPDVWREDRPGFEARQAGGGLRGHEKAVRETDDLACHERLVTLRLDRATSSEGASPSGRSGP